MKLTFENYLKLSAYSNVVIVYPGRFQPAHKNHAKVYSVLAEKFETATVYVATTNKVSPPNTPFSFIERKKMLEAAGVPGDKIVQTANPYVAQEIKSLYDPAVTKIIFAVGAKDMSSDKPRFNFLPTQKGDAYFKPLGDILKITPKNVEEMFTLDKHGYVAIAPTYSFSINITGKPLSIKGATEIRELYRTASEAGKQEIITQLYGSFNEDIYELFNNKLL